MAANGNNQSIWPVLAAIVLILGAIGLPLTRLFEFGLLVGAFLICCYGTLTSQARRWVVAAGIAAAILIGRPWLESPRVDEGHNGFIVERSGGALERELPRDVFQFMRGEFEAEYPVDRRCNPEIYGCWRSLGFPDRAYAFSADAVFDDAAFSRRARDIDFADPSWLRLGFVNDVRYNWYPKISDVQRMVRYTGFRGFFGGWQIRMPYFVMFRFAPVHVGSRLCWSGDVLWEQASGTFDHLSHDASTCRALTAEDAGRRIFGVSIRADRPFSMRLEANSTVTVWRIAEDAVTMLAVAALLLLLVRTWPRRALALPVVIVALSLVVIAARDVSFIGGFGPHGGGDDGLQYESYGRSIAENLTRGNVAKALEGSEPVFFSVPGFRYFRAIERFVFGDTNFGYLAVMLAMPFLVLALFRRFLPERWAIATVLVFIAFPIGGIVGSTYLQYLKWAIRGYGDPLAYFLFLAGLVVILGPKNADWRRGFGPAFMAGLLFALAVFVRPNLAPGAGVILGGYGVIALLGRHFTHAIGLCLGFAFILVMPLHNWVYGGTLLPFSSNAALPQTLVMPPAAWAAALSELIHLQLTAPNFVKAIKQLLNWLAGPAGSPAFVPFNAPLIAILIYVLCTQRRFDPLLRLVAWATLALHAVALFYGNYPRYYMMTWLLTLLVALVWLHDYGLAYFQERYPARTAALWDNPVSRRLADLLKTLEGTRASASG